MQKCGDDDDKSVGRCLAPPFALGLQCIQVLIFVHLTWDIISSLHHPLRYYNIFIAILIFIFSLFGIFFTIIIIGHRTYSHPKESLLWHLYLVEFEIVCKFFRKGCYRSVSRKWSNNLGFKWKIVDAKFQSYPNSILEWSLFMFFCPNNSKSVRFLFLRTHLTAAAPTVRIISRVILFLLCPFGVHIHSLGFYSQLVAI